MARAAVVPALAGVAWCVLAVPAGATEGPDVGIDRLEVSVGEPVLVTLTGFTGQAVTVAVCGNLGARGSADCNMPSSQSERVRENQPSTLTELIIQPPPVPCPCIVRASTSTNDELAVAPIVLLGHPEAPVVGSESGPLVDVAVDVEQAPQGFLDTVRSALGGPTVYDVTVSVRNRTTQILSNVVITGSASHRLDDDAATLDLEPPGPIEAGQTWDQTVRVELPAPVAGRFTWTVTASGAGSSVTELEATSATPVALLVLAVVLLLDLLLLVWRIATRGRRHGEHLPAGPAPSIAAISAPVNARS